MQALERMYYQEATSAQRLLPGVERYLEEARRLGLKTAIASSSSRDWVLEHLRRFELEDRFEAVVCREDVERTKPDPALYCVALQRLSADPNDAIALEDSSNGIRAAKAAGIYCVAVPNAMTSSMDLSSADLRLDCLESLPLSELLERAVKTQRS